MDQDTSDHIPVSSIVFFTSVFFTLITYGTFKILWKVEIPLWLLLVILGLQFATWLLGSSKVLTQLGAASLSAVIAMIACMAAVFLLFPPLLELRIAGATSGGAAALFILASLVAASRADPVPPSPHEPLDLGDIDVQPQAELIKYGEVQASDTEADQSPIAVEAEEEEAVSEDQSLKENNSAPPIEEDKVYEFDVLSESKLGEALGVTEDDSPPDILDLESEDIAKLLEGEPFDEPFTEVQAAIEPEPVEDQAFPDDWVEETARFMAYQVPAEESGQDREMGPEAEKVPPAPGMRTRYKVLDSESGEHYGTYYGDEGHSSLDPASLEELVGSRLPEGEPRIVKLDWSNFDEVEVHIRVEEVVPIDLDPYEETGTPESQVSSGEGKEWEPATGSASDRSPSMDDPVERTGERADESTAAVTAPRYMIYNRRTIQPMGEFVPEGNRSRIDRLTLYKMFPHYDFKTFEIDSVRWEEGEVRIFIKGEKKKGSGI